MFVFAKNWLFCAALIGFICGSAGGATYIFGDLNEDNVVNYADIGLFCEQWLHPTGYSGSACANLDNYSGVNLVDFAILTGNWQKQVGPLVINEFMADNDDTIEELGYNNLNTDSNFPDWIELYNPTTQSVNLTGWYLTDSRNNLEKWPFPSVSIPAGGYYVVYASNKDTYPELTKHPYIGPGGVYHTNFQLSGAGEYLALVRPDGVIAYEYDDDAGDFPAQANDVSFGLFADNSRLVKGFFVAPTPGISNDINGLRNAGPAITNVTHSPAEPNDYDNIVVTARVNLRPVPVSNVTLYYRVMYGSEVALPMADNGSGADAIAGDGIYTAVIPNTASTQGQMVRWYVTVAGANGRSSRLPLYSPPMRLAQYFGTVIENFAINTQLPVLHWFAENPAGVDARDGAQASAFYQGRFYDNIYVRSRGGTMDESQVPNPSHKFCFNHGDYFVLDDDREEYSDIVVNTNMGEKTYIRQSLGFQIYAMAGVPCPDSFLIRTERNGQFYGLCTFIEQPNEQMLIRNGLDENGAMYKMYNRDSNWLPRPNRFDRKGADKETRKYDDRTDLQALVAGLDPNYVEARKTYVFDNVNFPEAINYFAATILMMDRDCVAKNHYLYRDSDGNKEWSVLPWDKDYSWGRNYGGASKLWQDEVTYNAAPIDSWDSLRDNWLARATQQAQPFRQMYLRRLYTLMEEMLKAPGTPVGQLFFEPKVDELLTYAGYDAHLDYLKWGNPWVRPAWATWGVWYPTQEMAEAIDILKTQYFAQRRTFLFNHSAFSGISSPVPPDIRFGTIEFDPVSGNQDEEYIELVNYTGYPIDISGWQLTGGVEYTFQGGTVLTSLTEGNKLYVSPNVVAFRARATSPKAGENRFVQGNYKGHLSNWGETINLFDRQGVLRATITYTGNPSDAQRYLRVTELMYHPANPDPCSIYNDEDYEFVELQNIGTSSIYLDNVHFSNGIDYRFPAGESGEPQVTIADVNLILHSHVWKYNSSGSNLGTTWREVGYNDTSWPSGAALIYREDAAMPAPWVKNTQFNPYNSNIITYYFRTTFNLNADPAHSDISLEGNFLIDDGAVVYINGSEARLIRMTAGQTDFDDFSTPPSVGNATNEVYSLPSTALVQGQNVVAVEVHQAGTGSSDVVFGMTLKAHIITTTYPQGSSDTELGPGEYVLVAKDPNAFVERYPGVVTEKIFGPYVGQLDNGGERIKLEDDANGTILDFTYEDNWYPATDGEGFSLVIVNPAEPNLDNWNEKIYWQPSAFAGGSPGEEDEGQPLGPDAIVINEVLAHSHAAAPDWIELYNTTGSAINIGGWFLSDDSANLQKYQIPADTWIPGNGYAVFYENTHFGSLFGLSENGEKVCLAAAENGQLTGYAKIEDFGASATGVSFGRFYKPSTDSYNFVAMASATPSGVNSYPKVGPVVINEIMYSPVSGNQDAEYIELYNMSAYPVPLEEWDSVLLMYNSWKFTDAIEFTFPAGTTIGAGQYMLIVKNIGTFLATYPGVPGNVPLLQWTTGNLSNSGEQVELSMPGDVDGGGQRCYIRLDRVGYSDGSHPENCPGGIDLWPISADGGGKSLAKANPALYGNDVANWAADDPSPGMAN